MSESPVQQALIKTRRFSCLHTRLLHMRKVRSRIFAANLPAGLEDLISSSTDRNTCNLLTKKAFLIMHPTQLFLVIQRGKRKEREKELSRLYVVTNLSWLCKKPALITRRNQETSSDCAGERVCVFLRCFSYVISLHMKSTIPRIFRKWKYHHVAMITIS